MRIVVTGGGGFLGKAICRQLLARGDRVIAYQRGPALQAQALGAEVKRGSVTDAERLGQVVDGADAVIHTAGKAGAWGRREDYFDINAGGTRNVIAACRGKAVRRLVFTSSPSVVHDDRDIEGGDESLPYPDHYEADYPASKALAEQAVMAANGPELATVSLRPHLIWGPGDNQLLPRLLDRARRGTLRIPGAAKLIDTVYVENAAAAHLLALDKLQSAPGTVGGKTYFISNDEPRSQAEIMTGLLAAAGIEVSIKPVPAGIALAAGAVVETAWRLLGLTSEPPVTRWSARLLSTAHWYDISAARRDIGYRAAVSIDEGLAALKAALQTERKR